MAKLLLCLFLLACLRLGMSTTTTNAPTDSTVNVSTAIMTEIVTNVTIEGTTMVMEVTTDNSTNGPTTMGITGSPVTTLPSPGRYAVNGTNGTCILMEFYLEVMIAYKSDQGKDETASVAFPSNSIPAGNCTHNARYFSLTYPDHEDWYIRMDFDVEGKMYEMTSLALQWKYEEPFFQDADKMGETDEIRFDEPKSLNVRADAGYTFQCKKRELQKDETEIILEEIKYQPYADESDKKGDFGKVEVCADDEPTKKPLVDDTGKIVGIVLGSLAGVVLIIGVLYFVMRRRSKRESYKSLD